MRYTLRYQQRDFDLEEGEFVVGRALSCQLALDDPLVSRTHARFLVSDAGVTLEDLGSRNGVRVNGQRIGTVSLLQHGDHVGIGTQELVLLAQREMAVDTLVQLSTNERDPFGLLGALADKALGMGRGDEAERLIGQQLVQILSDLESGKDARAESVDRAATYALRIAASTGSARWTDFFFRVYSAQKRLCPGPMVDELYTVLRRVQRPSPSSLRNYLDVLRTLELGPAERFLLNRLEGLEGLLSAR